MIFNSNFVQFVSNFYNSYRYLFQIFFKRENFTNFLHCFDYYVTFFGFAVAFLNETEYNLRMITNIKHAQFQLETERDVPNYFYAHKYTSTGYYAHFHRNTELYCVYSGIVHVTIDNNRYELHAGEAVYINSLKVHSYECVNAEIGFVLFGSDYLRQFYELFPNRQIPDLLYDREKNKRIFRLLDELGERNDRFSVLERYACTYGFLGMIVEEYGTVPVSTNRAKVRATISDIVDYIYKNSDKDLSLVSVAEHFHYDPQSLSHLFSKNIKMDIRNFINEIRIQNFIAIKSLPENSGKPVTELALQCGFNSAATFYRAYKKYAQGSE